MHDGDEHRRIDAALVEIEGRGLTMRAKFLRHAHGGLGACAPGLRTLAGGGAMTAGAISRVARELSLRHVAVIRKVCRDARPDLVCVHGQTVYHKPPLSWQLMQAAPIASALGAPVVCDLRSADIAAGGQGAPLTPLSDLVLFAGREERAIVNLGGFCNITTLPAAGARRRAASAELVRGLDVCVCNLLLDAVARKFLHRSYDLNGRAALRGTPDTRAGRALVELLRAQRKGGRSLGTGDELGAWIGGAARGLNGEDCAATAVAALGAVIASACKGAGTIVLAGGGARNRALVRAIAAAADAGSVVTTEVFGVPVGAREAAGFAVLGALAADGVPTSLAGVTGVRSAPRAGCFVPAP